MIFYNRSHDHLLFVDACLFSFQRAIIVERTTIIEYQIVSLLSTNFFKVETTMYAVCVTLYYHQLSSTGNKQIMEKDITLCLFITRLAEQLN
jgi:hypothetical protein